MHATAIGNLGLASGIGDPTVLVDSLGFTQGNFCRQTGGAWGHIMRGYIR